MMAQRLLLVEERGLSSRDLLAPPIVSRSNPTQVTAEYQSSIRIGISLGVSIEIRLCSVSCVSVLNPYADLCSTLSGEF